MQGVARMAHKRARLSSHRTIASRRRTAARMRHARQSTANIRKYSPARRRSRPCCMRSDRRAFSETFRPSRSDIERVGGEMRKIGVPVLRDLKTRRHPEALMIDDGIEKPHQG